MDLVKRVLTLRSPLEAKNKANSAKKLSDLYGNVKTVDGIIWPSLSAALGEEVDPLRWRFLMIKPFSVKKGSSIDKFSLVRTTLDSSIRIPETSYDFDGLIVISGSRSEVRKIIENNKWILKLPVVQLFTEDKLEKEFRHGGTSRLSVAGAISIAMSLIEGNSDKAESLMRDTRTALSDVVDIPNEPGNWTRRRFFRDKAGRVTAKENRSKKAGKKKVVTKRKPSQKAKGRPRRVAFRKVKVKSQNS